MPRETIRVDGDHITIADLEVSDPTLAELLRRHDPDEYPALVARVMAVGARGVLSMGLGVDVEAVEQKVRATLDTVTAEAEARVSDLLERASTAFAEGFDPQLRTSHMARTLSEFTGWRDEFLGRLDPGRAGSHTTMLLERIEDLLGPAGPLEQRLRASLDPEADGSAFARMQATVDRRMRELRDLIVEERGRTEGRSAEAERGTAQGFDFEDVVDGWLRTIAGSLGGFLVDRVGTVPGNLGPKRTVGDFVMEGPDGVRIVVEAKQQNRLTVAGRDGVLEELDAAMANRRAEIAICVAGKDAFPAEVGRFAVYGNRILVVDEGDGTMTSVAVRWALASLRSRHTNDGPSYDPAVVADRVQRIRKLAERFKTGQRALTDVGKSVDTVRQSLSDMRSDLLELVDDLAREMRCTV